MISDSETVPIPHSDNTTVLGPIIVSQSNIAPKQIGNYSKDSEMIIDDSADYDDGRNNIGNFSV